MIDYSKLVYPMPNSTRTYPLWWCDAHQWAINANNSGHCIRCDIRVNSSKEADNIKGCIPHLVRAFGCWKQMETNEKD